MSHDPKAAILAMADDGPLVPLDGVPGAFIRRLSITEVENLAKATDSNGVHLLAMAIVDATGSRLFTDAEAENLKALKAAPFRRLFDQVAQENRVGAFEAEDMIKN